MSALFGDDLLPRPRAEIAPGAVHVPGRLTHDQQSWIVDRFREWMVRLGRRALLDADDDPVAAAGYTPDTALVNFYDETARMGH